MDLQAIAERMFDEAAKEAVRNVIERRTGSALPNEIIELLRREAKQMIENDPEIRQMLRNALVYWIRRTQ